ncbi:MAG: excinuclease ABC subunit UvrC [Candidatus Daviesbacteria bacterium]|nr:excinuclease ABC subunit UvrC [Candidatus Daviesbacteria bacterium]
MIPNSFDRLKIPHKPGIYIYKDKSGNILYVGKAIDLYHRVGSYFTGKNKDPKTAKLVSEIHSLETIIVESEIEALILEANYIKRYLPPFNIRLTDDKDYLYIKITKEEFPQILVARKQDLGDAKEYFGPFPSGRTVRTTLKKLRRFFPWCSISNDPLKTKSKRPCFYYHLGLCPGSCADIVDKHEYNKIIRQFSSFMQGKKEEVLEEYEKEMNGYVKSLEFERAEQIKVTLEGLKYLLQSNRTSVYLENPNFIEDQTKKAVQELKDVLKLDHIPQRIECYDISNTMGQQAVGSLVVLTGGEVDKKWYRRFKIRLENKPNDVMMLREMVQRRCRHHEWPKPDLILVDGGKPQVGAVSEQIKLAGWNVPVFGLAKRLELVVAADYSTIRLPRNSLALKILQRIRDEAHRFAIIYHRKLRSSFSFS